MLTYHATRQDGQPWLRLVGSLTIYTVAEARKEIPAWLDRHEAQALDLSGVEELDTAGAQLLLWLKREPVGHGCGLTFIQHSPVVLEVLEQLKLSAILGDPILLPPSVS